MTIEIIQATGQYIVKPLAVVAIFYFLIRRP